MVERKGEVFNFVVALFETHGVKGFKLALGVGVIVQMEHRFIDICMLVRPDREFIEKSVDASIIFF